MDKESESLQRLYDISELHPNCLAYHPMSCDIFLQAIEEIKRLDKLAEERGQKLDELDLKLCKFEDYIIGLEEENKKLKAQIDSVYQGPKSLYKCGVSAPYDYEDNDYWNDY